MAKHELLQKSPAEFFAENKNIAGFDNPGKCLYTTVRELVENSLDAAESISQLPNISVTIEEIGLSSLNVIRGVRNTGRLDEELYKEFEDEQTKKKRVAKEARELKKLEQAVAKNGAEPEEMEQLKTELEAKRILKAAKGQRVFYKITVKDNGMGMAHKDIPNLLGRVLSGTKYGVQQTRGKFGLGAKMALIWSKMSTGMPIEIWSSQQNSTSVSHYVLDIDIHKNEPNVHDVEKLPNPDNWHGSTLAVTIQGSLQTGYRAKILRYLQQIAVITPYAGFDFDFRSEDGKGDLQYSFQRRTNKMPKPPQIVKHHPASTDLEMIKQLLRITKTKTLCEFLHTEFSNISKEYAGRLITETQSGLTPKMSPHKLTTAQVTRLHQLFHEAKFKNPSGVHLSPAGEYNLRLGIIKEMKPEFLATHQGEAKVLEGHSFIVEAAVCFGARDMRQGITVHRFANRIPLLFEAGSDVITRTVMKRISWANYKMNQSTDKIGVFVSVVSTKIPYKGAGKEYIADDMEELVIAVKHAIQQCCVQLKVKIVKRNAKAAEEMRKQLLSQYIKDASTAVYQSLRRMTEPKKLQDEYGPEEQRKPAGGKRKNLEKSADVLEPIKRRKYGQKDIEESLQEYIDKIDSEQAMEYTVQQGLTMATTDNLHIMPRLPEHTYGPPLYSDWGVIRVLGG